MECKRKRQAIKFYEDLIKRTVIEMAWKYVLSYIASVVLILIWNDAFNVETLNDFTKNFRSLVDELAVYFEPCGFPIELVSRFCTERLQKIL